jgi:hypothetical protein
MEEKEWGKLVVLDEGIDEEDEIGPLMVCCRGSMIPFRM